MNPFMGSKRVILIVLDSVGIGELPDAQQFGDAGSNTLGHIAAAIKGFSLPNLQSLGLGNIGPETGLAPVSDPKGAFAKAAEKSPGKDTTTGHWEIGGLLLQQAFPIFPNGFPESFILEYEKKIGISTVGNKTASGTEILEELGAHHLATGELIVYTSADSVFQIAAHEEKYSPGSLYQFCETAREMLKGELAVGRVIARPFIGEPGNFSRTHHRRDFSLPPPGDTILDLVKAAGKEVVGVGKISDIFAGQGISHSYKSIHNMDGVNKTLYAMEKHPSGLIMTNLVDFDQNFGHRRDVQGYADALTEFDRWLPELLVAMTDDDVLILTADHGNDPTFKGSDHTREHVPILLAGKKIIPGANAGLRESFADIAATISDLLGVNKPANGKSFFSTVYHS